MEGRHRGNPAWQDGQVQKGSQAPIALTSWLHRILRDWFSLRPEPLDDEWTRTVTSLVFPEWSGARFLRDHPSVVLQQLGLVQYAFLQWLRIEGRHPGGHAIPSRAVLDMFDLLRSDDDQWTLFCEGLPPGEQVLTPPRSWDVWNPADRGDLAALRVTWAHAMQDEYRTDNLPTLFWVDEVCGLPGAAQIYPTCIDSPCRSEPPVVCLHCDTSASPTIGG
jgi:hypothetical protein